MRNMDFEGDRGTRCPHRWKTVSARYGRQLQRAWLEMRQNQSHRRGWASSARITGLRTVVAWMSGAGYRTTLASAPTTGAYCPASSTPPGTRRHITAGPGPPRTPVSSAWQTPPRDTAHHGRHCARGTMDRLGRKRFRAIERQQVLAITQRHRCQCLATLELANDALAQRAEHLGRARVKEFTPVRVARDPLNAVDGVQIALGARLVKGQARGGFEGQRPT